MHTKTDQRILSGFLIRTRIRSELDIFDGWTGGASLSFWARGTKSGILARVPAFSFVTLIFHSPYLVASRGERSYDYEMLKAGCLLIARCKQMPYQGAQKSHHNQ